MKIPNFYFNGFFTSSFSLCKQSFSLHVYSSLYNCSVSIRAAVAILLLYRYKKSSSQKAILYVTYNTGAE